MRANAWEDTSRANWIDYALCWLSSALAVYSCGQAVATNMVSTVGVIGVTIGIWFSYLIRAKLGNTWLAKIDGYLYCTVAWVAVLVARQMNIVFFPEDTFPVELTPSSWLYWMTVFGSFFAFRDGTLIFQSIPALAIFGFVGCYDTFKFVPFLFFLFLICFATLFARAHGRDMQVRAVESGFFLLGRNSQMNPSEQSAALRDGPWRWAAGAEWALGSAMVIVVLSLIGAPVIQATAKPLSGFVTIRPPRLRPNPPNQSASAVPTVATVGTGPVRLSDLPYFEVSGDVPEYARIGSFNIWNGRAWSVSALKGESLKERDTGFNVGTETSSMEEKFRFPNKKPNAFPDEYRVLTLNIRALVPSRELPQSGNDPEFSGNKTYDKGDGGMSLKEADKYEGKVIYDKVPLVGPNSNVPTILDSHLYSHTSTAVVKESVRQLALDVTKGQTSDFAKARAIQEEVTKRIKYNTNVAATPENRDPVEYALMESHEGYCDLFASSMVLMARCVKIPARYAIGYLPDPKNRNKEGTQLMLESDRHAWAELYFENIGWVPFDATEGAQIVPGGGRKDNKPFDYNAMLRKAGVVLDFLIGIAVVVGLWLFIRIKRLPKTVAMIRSEMDTEYVAFIGSIWKYTGHRRLLSETTNEYLARVGGQLGDLRAEADEIGLLFTNKMFGQPEIMPNDVVEVRESVQQFRGLISKIPKLK